MNACNLQEGDRFRTMVNKIQGLENVKFLGEGVYTLLDNKDHPCPHANLHLSAMSERGTVECLGILVTVVRE